MKNRIEEKIGKFINETEVGMVVAPELNVDRDRATWLKKQGFDDVEGLSDGREMQAGGVFEASKESIIGKGVSIEVYDGRKLSGAMGKVVKQLSNGKFLVKMNNGKTVERNRDEIELVGK